MTIFSWIFILIAYEMDFTDVFTDPIYGKTVFSLRNASSMTDFDI